MHIYCIGLGGIGMSSVARMAHALGHHVSGSDKSASPLLDELEQEGITVFIGHDAVQLGSPDLVLISQAVPYAAPDDYQEALRRGLPMISWQTYLAQLCEGKTVVAVCGTHGKSTTTGMVTSLCLEMNLDPTVMIGTTLKELGGKNFRVGKGEFVIIEADEYHENFLNYDPTYVILTSLEPDHLDYYKTEERYERAFTTFFEKARENQGIVIVPECEARGVEVAQAIHGLSVEVVPQPYTKSLGVFGAHNQWNASLVYALGKRLGATDEQCVRALTAFTGTWRRMELRGVISGGALVYDDYGHHPTEVRVTLAAFREKYPNVYICCVFQPHQYSRTYEHLEEFAQSFFDADEVIIPEIYESRDTEEDKERINVSVLVEHIRQYHKQVMDGGGLDATFEYIKQRTELQNENVVIVCMGAGTITHLATRLIKELI